MAPDTPNVRKRPGSAGALLWSAWLSRRVIREDLRHRGGELDSRRHVQELVRSMRIRARTQHAGDEELRLGESLAQHAHERNRPAGALEHRRLAEAGVRRAVD